MSESSLDLMSFMIWFHLALVAVPALYLGFKFMRESLKFDDWERRTMKLWRPA